MVCSFVYFLSVLNLENFKCNYEDFFVFSNQIQDNLN